MNWDFVNWFRHSSPYINTHRGKTFVLAVPGEALMGEFFANLIHDIALLSSLGIRLVLVHGARPQIDQQLTEAGITSQFHKHWRITDADSINRVAQANAGVRIQFEAALSTGLPNSPLHGAHLQVVSGNFITAMPIGIIDGIDLQHTGKVRRVDVRATSAALDAGALVLVSALGYSPTGEIFNLAYQDVAGQMAMALNADKLIHFTDSDSIIDENQEVREISLDDCQQLINSQLANHSGSASRIETLSSCYQAVKNGVPRASLINYQRDGALLTELFTVDGCGTLIHADDYLNTHKASIDDVGGILELLKPLEDKGILLRRSRELLETEINNFWLLEKDGMVISCAALYPFDNGSAELACLATNENYRGSGHAGTMLKRIEKEAKAIGVKQLFLLTTQTAHWFIEQGFQAGDLNQLPKQKQQLYNLQRNSKIFIKQIV